MDLTKKVSMIGNDESKEGIDICSQFVQLFKKDKCKCRCRCNSIFNGSKLLFKGTITWVILANNGIPGGFEFTAVPLMIYCKH
jgi:hypothetical protein